MSESLELFSARVCPYAHRSRLVMMEKGLPFELIEIDLSNKPARFLEVSAYGKVPALVHGAVEIYESAVINEYLDEVYPEPPMLPAGAAGRAMARIWIDYCNHRFLDDVYGVMKARGDAEQAAARDRINAHFRFLESNALGRLGSDGPYWFGVEPSLVDYAWYPHFERLPAWNHYRGVYIPENCPRLRRWLEAMRQRETVRAIANTPDYYIERYAGYAA